MGLEVASAKVKGVRPAMQEAFDQWNRDRVPLARQLLGETGEFAAFQHGAKANAGFAGVNEE